MSAHVYYDKNRKRYYIKNYVNKVNHTIIFDNNGNYFHTKRDCYVFINENLKALENQPKKPKKNETLNTCDEFKAILDKQLKISGSRTQYQKFLKYVYPFVEETTLFKINNETLQKITDNVNGLKLSKKSKRCVFVVAKKYFDYLSKKLGKNLDLSILVSDKNEFDEDKIFNYLTVEEFNKFDSALETKRDQLIFELLFIYGLRIGELRALKNKDFDLQNNLLLIRRALNSKNETHTSIVISPKTSSSIREYPLLESIKNKYLSAMKFIDNKETFVFTTAKERTKSEKPYHVISETQIRRIKVKAIEKSGVVQFRIHDLRHSCAINLIQNGFDISRIASWLGHKNVSVTAKYYLKYSDKNKEEIAKFFLQKNLVRKNE